LPETEKRCCNAASQNHQNQGENPVKKQEKWRLAHGFSDDTPEIRRKIPASWLNLHPMLSLLLPSRPEHPLFLPHSAQNPALDGRTLPNGMLIVEDPHAPDALYKCTPWGSSELAWNEIEIYARMGDLPGITPLLGVAGNPEYLVRKMQRSHHGALSAFLFNTCKGDPALMPCGLVLSLLAEIARTMMYLHAQGIIHRDLKSENILVFDQHADFNDWRSVHPKISDFDRAVELPPGGFLDAPVGSLLHMAPELLAWARYDRKVDIYAFGIVMFEIAHGGRVPYYNVATGLPGGLTSAEFSARVVNAGLRPDWSYQDPILKQLAEECWAKHPAERPEFAEIVARLARHAGHHETPQAYTPQTISRPRRAGVGFAGHLGRVRSTMEDALCVLDMPDALIAGIFDGLRDALDPKLKRS